MDVVAVVPVDVGAIASLATATLGAEDLCLKASQRQARG